MIKKSTLISPNIDSRETLKVEIENSKIDFLEFSDFRVISHALHADNFET